MKKVPKEIQSWAASAKLIWWLIEENNGIVKTDIWKTTKISKQTIKHQLSSLERNGLVKETEDGYKVNND